MVLSGLMDLYVRQHTLWITPLIFLPPTDLESAFVRSMVNDLLVKEGEDCTLPCLVTDPAVTHLSLLTCSGTALPAGLSFSADPQRGAVIHNITKAFEGCYVCTGLMDGSTVKSSQYNVNVRRGLSICVRKERKWHVWFPATCFNANFKFAHYSELLRNWNAAQIYKTDELA